MKLHEARWVHVVWCDDIRQELGNKPSLMGVYTGALVVPAMPATLPRLAAWITVHTPRERHFKKLAIRIARNDADNAVAEINLDDIQLEMPGVPPEPAEDEAKTIILSFVLLLGPLQLTETTRWFKVFVETEDEVLESYKLLLQAAQQA